MTTPNMGDPTHTTPSYGDPDGFTSPSQYHHSEMPMMHLQGDMGPTYEQAPMDESAVYMNERPQTGTGIVQEWDSSSLASTGGDHSPVHSSDHNGYRTPPAQGPTSA